MYTKKWKITNKYRVQEHFTWDSCDIHMTFNSSDMIYYGLIGLARAMAIRYGDGLANVEFWKESLYWYNLHGKVITLITLIINFTFHFLV